MPMPSGELTGWTGDAVGGRGRGGGGRPSRRVNRTSQAPGVSGFHWEGAEDPCKVLSRQEPRGDSG